uniref:Uncharacterized protein n=1 Tax=Romanomermis culicivorax TaxID=13658 RepID=A0A915JBW8_ROMCU
MRQNLPSGGGPAASSMGSTLPGSKGVVLSICEFFSTSMRQAHKILGCRQLGERQLGERQLGECDNWNFGAHSM